MTDEFDSLASETNRLVDHYASDSNKENVQFDKFSNKNLTNETKKDELLPSLSEDSKGVDVKAKIEDIVTPTSEFKVESAKAKAKDLIYWRNPKETAVVFICIALLLFFLASYSVISVFAYACLALLCATTSFYVYQSVANTLNKSKDGHVFKEYLQQDVCVSPEYSNKVGKCIVSLTNDIVVEARHIFLIEDIVDTGKFAFLLWLLTYIGRWFNGFTLLCLVFVFVFTFPKFYDTYHDKLDGVIKNIKDQCEKYLDVALTTLKEQFNKIKEKVTSSSTALLAGKKKN